jgi:hypothetical protein
MMELQPPSLLIDQGLFNILVGKETTEAHYNFFSSKIFDILCGSVSDKSSFTVSLATILEAIGIKPPHLSGIVIPANLTKNCEPEAIIEWLRQEFHQFYLSKPELSPHELREAVERQRNHCSSEGIRFFDMCVTRIVELPTFHQSLLSFLEFDAIQKFDFPKVVKDQMHCFMTIFYIFRGDLKIRNASKFRLVKQLWKNIYPATVRRLNSAAKSELDAMNKIVMVKNQTDYLDCDLVHQAVFGIEQKNGFERVHCFTLENLDVVQLRIRAYKGFIQKCQQELSVEMIGQTPQGLVSRANGMVVECAKDGLAVKVLDVRGSAPVLFD